MVTHWASRLQCAVCGNHQPQADTSQETIWQLPLSSESAAADTGDVVSLEELIAQDMNNALAGYRCESCETNGVAAAHLNERRTWRSRTLLNLPEVFALSFIRFEVDDDAKVVKSNRKVTFPEVLDLGRHLESEGVPDPAGTQYRLVSAISHSGTRSRGHYICDVRAGDSWWQVNDDQVTGTTLEGVIDRQNRPTGPKKPAKPFTPYILMYEKMVEQAPYQVEAPQQEPRDEDHHRQRRQPSEDADHNDWTEGILQLYTGSGKDEQDGRVPHIPVSGGKKMGLSHTATTTQHPDPARSDRPASQKRAASPVVDDGPLRKRRQLQTAPPPRRPVHNRPGTSGGGQQRRPQPHQGTGDENEAGHLLEHEYGFDGSCDGRGREREATPSASGSSVMATFRPARVFAAGAFHGRWNQGASLSRMVGALPLSKPHRLARSRTASPDGFDFSDEDGFEQHGWSHEESNRPDEWENEEDVPPAVDDNEDERLDYDESATEGDWPDEETDDEVTPLIDHYWSSEVKAASDSDAASTVVEDYMFFEG